MTARDLDTLADEIAHDLVAPPDDDAAPSTVAAVLRCVAVATLAARESLAAGADIDTAREAADAALDRVIL